MGKVEDQPPPKESAAESSAVPAVPPVPAESARERIRRAKEREAARSVTRTRDGPQLSDVSDREIASHMPSSEKSNVPKNTGTAKPGAVASSSAYSTASGKNTGPQLSDGSDRETGSPMPSSEKSNVPENTGTTKPGAVASSSAYPTASGKNTGPRLTDVPRDAVASSSGDSLIDGADTKTPEFDDSSIAEPGAVRMKRDGKAHSKPEIMKADSQIQVVAMLVNEDEDVAKLKETLDEHTKEIEADLNKCKGKVKEMEEEREKLEEKIEKGTPQENIPVAVVESEGSSKKRRIACTAGILVLIAIIVGLAVGLSGGKSSDSPSTGTSPPPEEQKLTKEQECELVAEGTALEGQEDLIIKNFTIETEITLANATDMEEPLLAELQTKVQQILAPVVAGCSNAAGRKMKSDSNFPGFFRGTRKLYLSEPVANAIASVELSGDKSCKEEATGSCFRVAILIELFLRDDERTYNLVNRIYDSFVGEFPLAEELKLGQPFEQIEVLQVRSIDPKSEEIAAVLNEHDLFRQDAFNWLAYRDTWTPPENTTNTSTLWLERFASVAFYYGADMSLLETNWLSTSHICEWDYLNCTGGDQVTHFGGIDSQEVQGTLPDEIGLLTALTYLSIRHTKMGGNINPLVSLLNLQYLDFDECKLSGSLSALTNLTALQHVDVDQNDIKGTFPDISALTGLRFFDISHNDVSGAISDISSLTNLAYLDLKKNDLGGTIPELASLTSLTYLRLADNILTGCVPPLPSTVGQPCATPEDDCGCRLEDNKLNITCEGSQNANLINECRLE